MKNHSTKRTTILAVLLSVFLFQQAASKIGKYVANIFDYSLIDSYNVFAWISVHHIVQTLLALVPIIILSKIYNIDFGFRLGDKKTGLKLIRIYTIAMLVYITFTSVITYFGVVCDIVCKSGSLI